MDSETTKRWKNLYRKNCAHWDDGLKMRYLNIPNDRDDIDEEELQSCIDLIVEINKKPAVE